MNISRDEWLDEGRAIVNRGEAQAVIDGLDMVPSVQLHRYWDSVRRRIPRDGDCGNCGACEMVRFKNGSQACPHTGLPCERERLKELVELFSTIGG